MAVPLAVSGSTRLLFLLNWCNATGVQCYQECTYWAVEYADYTYAQHTSALHDEGINKGYHATDQRQ